MNKEILTESKLAYWKSLHKQREQIKLRKQYPICKGARSQTKIWIDFKKRHKEHNVFYIVITTNIGMGYDGICENCMVSEDLTDYDLW